MTTQVFYDRLVEFCKLVKKRPALLIYDDHFSHVSLPLIEKAVEENIIIVKFLLHVTDKMQPLDVTCFSPLKRRWENLLASPTNTPGPRECLSKSLFVDLLCSNWRKELSAANAISGFKATGIFPVDKQNIPKNKWILDCSNGMKTESKVGS